jgi:hypothetical protein
MQRDNRNRVINFTVGTQLTLMKLFLKLKEERNVKNYLEPFKASIPSRKHLAKYSTWVVGMEKLTRR